MQHQSSSGGKSVMKREAGAPSLSAVFVDYDNIYLSLKRKNEEAAKRFAKDAGVWLRQIENGHIITPTNGIFGDVKRRIVLNRCYGNPVPRRNSHDNSTDMNSFPFVRHHFLRSGFEVVDCPPLTAQLKNSSDIRMVMDLRDYLTHDTYFDEFIILSGDADFTPVLQRLRQHARRTVIFANDYTAAPYTAICDGEIREQDLIALLLGDVGAGASLGATIGHPEANDVDLISQPQMVLGAVAALPPAVMAPQPIPLAAEPVQLAAPAPALAPSPHAASFAARLDELREAIIGEVAAGVRAAAAPVPLEALADRAMRVLGHDRTVGTGWAGTGGFRELLRMGLPPDIRLTDQPPYYAYDPQRHVRQEAPRQQPMFAARAEPPQRVPAAPLAQALPQPLPPVAQPPLRAPPPQRASYEAQPMRAAPRAEPAALPPQRPAGPAPRADAASAVQQTMARIYEACQTPALAPGEYRLLFEVMTDELRENHLLGAQTLINIAGRARERGLELRREDVRFVLEVVSEADPWFEQGSSADLFAGRFRNFVVARCRGQGMTLSADELDLIDAWFAGGAGAEAGERAPPQAPAMPAPMDGGGRSAGGRWWSNEEPRDQPAAERYEPQLGAAEPQDEFPRIVRARALRG